MAHSQPNYSFPLAAARLRQSTIASSFFKEKGSVYPSKSLRFVVAAVLHRNTWIMSAVGKIKEAGGGAAVTAIVIGQQRRPSNPTAVIPDTQARNICGNFCIGFTAT